MGPWLSALVPTPQVLPRNLPSPASPVHTPPNTAPSGNQHRHTTSEKHTKEPGSKGKKNRNLKIGKITVSEKWRESVFRKITNANELKYLDEFLLNKVGPRARCWGQGLHAQRAPGRPQRAVTTWQSFPNRPTKAHIRQEQKVQVHSSHTQKVPETRSSCCGAVEMNPTRNREIAGSIPGLTHWVKDLA